MATKLSDDAVAGSASARRAPFLVRLYRSAVGKKYVMAITGLVFMGYVLAHMIGNLKLYQGTEALTTYEEFLRRLAYPLLPEGMALNLMRVVLALALIFHVVAAAQLTRMNHNARPDRYRSKRDYVAADFAARSMRWTGVIVLLFVLYHLADFTLTWVNPAPADASLYDRVVASFQIPAVSAFYLFANLALGVHLYHGVWSLFQSLGWNHRRFNHWRRPLAVGFTVVVIGGNLSFPIAVLTGVVN